MPANGAPDGRAPRAFVVLAFNSTRESLAAEAALAEAGFSVRAVPLPPHRGKLCGIALRLPPNEEREALELLETRRLTVAARDEIEDF